MPRVVRTESLQQPSLPFTLVGPVSVSEKPATYIPEYKQMGFQFLSVEESEMAIQYEKFVPFLFSHNGNRFCTYSEFAVRNAFRLETGMVMNEAMSYIVLQKLHLDKVIDYVFSEFHNQWRWAHL